MWKVLSSNMGFMLLILPSRIFLNITRNETIRLSLGAFGQVINHQWKISQVIDHGIANGKVVLVSQCAVQMANTVFVPRDYNR